MPCPKFRSQHLIAIALLLITTQPQSLANNYYVSSGADTTSCSNLSTNDICNFYCDEQTWKGDIDCGNSSECNIYCSKGKCLETSIIYAQNTVNLNIYASGIENECYKNAIINAPNHGNAIFINNGTGNNAFKGITVNSGTNTQNIIIDCIGVDNIDECKDIQINVTTAQFLRINVDDGQLGPGTVICPINSAYNGPEISSCIIDVSGGGILNGLTLHAINGIPNDIWIETSVDTSVMLTTLTCAKGIVTDSDILSNNNTCYHEITSTKTPTIYPTNNPIAIDTQITELAITSTVLLDANDENRNEYNEDKTVGSDPFNDSETNIERAKQQIYWYLFMGIIVCVVLLLFGMVIIRFLYKQNKKLIIDEKAKMQSHIKFKIIKNHNSLSSMGSIQFTKNVSNQM